jgi:signal transduction histidine kinase
METVLSNTDPAKKAKTFRIVGISGFLFFASFGATDYLLLPDNYLNAWIIRFGVLGIFFAIPLLLSFQKWFIKHVDNTALALLIIAQACLFLIILMSTKNEIAYYDYSYGLTLIILWAAFIFRIKTKTLLFFSIASLIGYNFIAIGHQVALSNGTNSDAFAHFINTNLILISTYALAVTGSYLLYLYEKRIEQENLLNKEALEKAKQGEQIKTNFLNTMSHEIRTPLNGIIGFSNILISEPDSVDVKESAETINRQAYQLLNVLTSMLEFSELNTEKDLGERSKISIKQLIVFLKKRFAAMQENSNKTHLVFKIDFDEQFRSQYLYTYVDRLQFVLLAILDNAIKFSESGTITMNMRLINDANVIFSISDEGIGLKDGYDQEVFSEFSQLDAAHNRKYEGIGMGLSISRRIINLMGGEIWYKLNKDKGTSFFVSVPKILRRI